MSALTMTNSVVSNNVMSADGCIDMVSQSPGSYTLNIFDSHFIGNLAGANGVTANVMGSGNTVSMSNTTIESCVSLGDGNIRVENGDVTLTTNVIIQNNNVTGSGGRGSALSHWGSIGGRVTFTNTVSILNNRANTHGSVYIKKGDLSLNSVTFDSNVAVSGDGGAVYLQSAFGSEGRRKCSDSSNTQDVDSSTISNSGDIIRECASRACDIPRSHGHHTVCTICIGCY